MEGLLSLDNALALAAMVKHLVPEKRNKALTYGIVGAFVFRFLALSVLGFVINYPLVRILGGAYLLWLAVKYFLLGGEDNNEVKSSEFAFWRTVVAVEITDMAFSFDSILAAYGVSTKLFVLVIGGVLGIIMMRFAAIVFVKLIDKFPRLEKTAYILISIVGSRLVLDSFYESGGELEQWIVWALMTSGVLYGLSYKRKVYAGVHHT
jgi:YkoY family integral membrane protein